MPETTTLTRFSNSTLKTFRECTRKFSWKFRHNLEPTVKPPPLQEGSIFHKLLEDFYTTGGKNAKRILKQYATSLEELEVMEGEEEKFLSALELARIFSGYAIRYRHELDDLEVVGVEDKLELDLELTDETVTLVGKVDLVMRFNGLVIMDHKLTKRVPSGTFRLLDTQSALYVWMWEQIHGEAVDRFLFNYVRRKPPTIPELLKNGTLTRRKNLDTDHRTYLKAIQDNDLEEDDYSEELARAKERDDTFFLRVPVEKPKSMLDQVVDSVEGLITLIRRCEEDDNFPMCITKACDWCSYKDLCLLEMEGRDPFEVIGSIYRVRRTPTVELSEEDVE